MFLHKTYNIAFTIKMEKYTIRFLSWCKVSISSVLQYLIVKLLYTFPSLPEIFSFPEVLSKLF